MSYFLIVAMCSALAFRFGQYYELGRTIKRVDELLVELEDESLERAPF